MAHNGLPCLIGVDTCPRHAFLVRPSVCRSALRPPNTVLRLPHRRTSPLTPVFRITVAVTAQLMAQPKRIHPGATASDRTDPPQAGQVSMSMPKTRSRRCARFIAARPSAGAGSSGPAVDARCPPASLGRCHPRAVYLLLGANTPWKRGRLTRGFGTSAANRATKSSGSKMTWVVLSRYDVCSWVSPALPCTRDTCEPVHVVTSVAVRRKRQAQLCDRRHAGRIRRPYQPRHRWNRHIPGFPPSRCSPSSRHRSTSLGAGVHAVRRVLVDGGTAAPGHFGRWQSDRKVGQVQQLQ
jgi:hypothetical protein